MPLRDFALDDGELIGYHGKGGVVEIPENVTSISADAISKCGYTVTALKLPDSVTSFGEGAFESVGTVYINITSPLKVRFDETGFENYKIMRDINDDKKIDFADADFLGGHIAGGKTAELDAVASDADGNGSITLADLMRIFTDILTSR